MSVKLRFQINIMLLIMLVPMLVGIGLNILYPSLIGAFATGMMALAIIFGIRAKSPNAKGQEALMVSTALLGTALAFYISGAIILIFLFHPLIPIHITIPKYPHLT